MAQVVTIDFHVTSECNQSWPYCWGPQDFEHPVDTATALRIIERVKTVGATRIVFTGGVNRNAMSCNDTQKSRIESRC